MSTFMGLAWIDLAPGADTEAALAGLHELEASAGAVKRPDGRDRIMASSDDYGRIADIAVSFAERTGLASHAFIVLDHDEYGAEHIAIDAHETTVRRAYHYYVYPRWEETGAYYTEGVPSLTWVPGIEEPVAGDDPGVLVDGPLARATVAARYGVPVEAVDRAAAADALAHEGIQVVGRPSAHWRDALGLAWPGEF